MRILGSLLFANLQTRLLALILSLFTWFYVYRESTEVFPPTPVNIDVRVPARTVLLGITDETGRPINQVELRVRGPRGSRTEFRTLRLTKFIAEEEIQASGSALPSVTFEVTEDLFQLPPKFKLVEVKPRRLRVVLDKLDEKLMRLTGSPITGQPAAGLRVKSVTLQPPYVNVSGPQTVVRRYGEIPVQPVPVNLAELSVGRHEFPVKIQSRVDDHEVATASLITAVVVIEEEPETAEFQVEIDLKVPMGYLGEFEVEAKDRVATLSVTGPKAVMRALKTNVEALTVVIDLRANLRKDEREPTAEKEWPIRLFARANIPGADELKITFKIPEKPETVVKIRPRAK